MDKKKYTYIIHRKFVSLFFRFLVSASIGNVIINKYIYFLKIYIINNNHHNYNKFRLKNNSVVKVLNIFIDLCQIFNSKKRLKIHDMNIIKV